jgi:putative transposase
VKYAFIKQNECNVPVTKQCRWLCVSTSGYYDWQARQSKPPTRSERQSVIDEAIAVAFNDRRERYGSPRLTINLNEAGFPIAENTVAASMHRQGLVAKAGRKFKATTNSKHKLPVAPNLLEQDFSCSAINEKWCGDITYLWTNEGWMYLAVVLDLFSRRVIGWSLSHRMTAHLACDAMQMAIGNRGEIDATIMHTDRGSQYCSKQFQRLLKANGILSSMSKKGDCYDNACAESFFHSLKVEAIHGETIETRDLMRKVIFDYIELDYNTHRHHSAINNTSPVQFELVNAA